MPPVDDALAEERRREAALDRLRRQLDALMVSRLHYDPVPRPQPEVVADGILYQRDTGLLIINGVEFSPEVLAHLTPASGEWRGPYWIRRVARGGDRALVEVTTIDPVERGRDH